MARLRKNKQKKKPANLYQKYKTYIKWSVTEISVLFFFSITQKIVSLSPSSSNFAFFSNFNQLFLFVSLWVKKTTKKRASVTSSKKSLFFSFFCMFSLGKKQKRTKSSLIWKNMLELGQLQISNKKKKEVCISFVEYINFSHSFLIDSIKQRQTRKINKKTFLQLDEDETFLLSLFFFCFQEISKAHKTKTEEFLTSAAKCDGSKFDFGHLLQHLERKPKLLEKIEWTSTS